MTYDRFKSWIVGDFKIRRQKANDGMRYSVTKNGEWQATKWSLRAARQWVKDNTPKRVPLTPYEMKLKQEAKREARNEAARRKRAAIRAEYEKVDRSYKGYYGKAAQKQMQYERVMAERAALVSNSQPSPPAHNDPQGVDCPAE
jgi:hypothetical protein